MNGDQIIKNAQYYRSLYSRGSIDPYRLKILSELGFIWNTIEHKWKVKFEKLQAFYIENGHCNVPMENRQLRNWLEHQRANRKKNILTKEKIELLDTIKFVWKPMLRAGTLFSDAYPQLVVEWNTEENAKIGLNLKTITIGHQKIKAHWICQNVPSHKWQCTVNQRTNTAINNGRGSGCPYCVGQKVSTDNCLATTHPEYAKLWHPEKNEKLTPMDFTAGSSKKKIWWICASGKHELFMTPYDMTCKNKEKFNGNGCKYCSNQVACHDNCLSTLFPLIAAEWHPTKNGKLNPTDIIPKSQKKRWWKCSVCQKTWHQSPHSRTTGSVGVGCLNCKLTNFRERYNKDLPLEKSIITTHPDLCKQIDHLLLGDVKLELVSKGSSLKLPWKCFVCSHKWYAVVSNRCKGIGCPMCGRKKVWATRRERMEPNQRENMEKSM